MPEPQVDRRVIREHLEKRERYFATQAQTGVSYGAVADEIVKLLAERYNIAVVDSDWS